MSNSATVLVSTLFAGATAVATVFLMHPASSSTPDAPSAAPELAAKLDAVLSRLDQLESRVASRVEPAAVRTATGPTRAEIEGWIAEAIGRSGATPAAADTAPEFRVDAALARMTEASASRNDRDAIWAEARAAGQVKALVAAFEQRAAENPGDADAQAQLGDAYVQAIVGATDILTQSTFGQKADKAYDAALALDETHWSARFSKAVGLTFWPDFLGKKAEAIKNFEILATQQEARASRPEFVETWVTLGNLYEQQGKEDDARKTWERGLAQFPNEPRLRSKLGR